MKHFLGVLIFILLPYSLFSQQLGPYPQENVMPDMMKKIIPARTITIENIQITWSDLNDFVLKDSMVEFKNNLLYVRSVIDQWKGVLIFNFDTATREKVMRFKFSLKNIENYKQLLSTFDQDTLRREVIARKLTQSIYHLATLNNYVSTNHLKAFRKFQEADKVKVYKFKSGSFYYSTTQTYNPTATLVSTISRSDKKPFQFLLNNLNYGYEFSRCYEPHDAVEFFKKEKSLGYIEICFQCDEVKFHNMETHVTQRFSFDYEFLVGYEQMTGN